MANRLLSLFACIILIAGCCNNTVTVKSPDGNLSISLSAGDGGSAISIRYGSRAVLDSTPVGIEFADGPSDGQIRIVGKDRRHVVDDYDLPAGKSAHVHSESNEVTVSLKDDSGRLVRMSLRAFDDGVAYRYTIPEQQGMNMLAIRRETMDLNIPGNPKVKAIPLSGFNCSHENFFVTEHIADLKDSTLFDMPALLAYPDGTFMAITEANVVDYAGMDLISEDGTLKGILSPRQDGSGLSVMGELPGRSPWRVFQVSDRLGSLLESDILTNLADPCLETDLSWLDPGLSTWPWWNCYQTPDGLKKGDINTINQNINRYYIDFCAENGIKYHSITGILDGDGGDICWYYNEGSNPGTPGENDDTSRPYPGFDMESVCRYAAEKGVEMRVWVHWKTLAKNMEETFRIYGGWGVRGLMIDFMDRDDQEMIDFQKNALDLAMKYHLHIQFHGSSKPSGLCRTYPCEFTRENTLNYEWYKWSGEFRGFGVGSGHDLNIAFVRTLAGPADYHLGSFRSVKAEEFNPVNSRPTTTSTRSHSLAMYVVLQSSLHLVSDAPEAYIGETGFEFIKEVPTAWDETRVLLSELDGYLVIARRKEGKWFVGGIGNSEPRNISLPLDFLGEGSFTMDLFHDTAASDTDLNDIEKSRSEVTSASTAEIHMAPNGGFAAVLTPISRD